MGIFLFNLPDIGEGVAEAEIVKWHVKPGEVVTEDQPLVDVMTDKATVEMTSPVDGTVIKIHGDIGSMTAVGSILAELDVSDPDLTAAPETRAAPTPRPTPEPIALAKAGEENVTRPTARPQPANAPPNPGRAAQVPANAPLAAPATRRRAHELGIPLQFVSGTGPGGRITPDDLEAYRNGGGTWRTASQGLEERSGSAEIKIIGLRRRIAEKMQEAKRRIPHFGYVEEFDLTELEELRAELNGSRKADQTRLTLLPFFMRAIVLTLPEFPQINARFDDDAGVLRTFEAVHLGIATQTPDGLMVPVVRHAEAKDLWRCASEMARVTEAARNGRATRDELIGSTITLTSLGPLGGVSATPVINHPEVAIIAPNKLVELPRVRDGRIVVRKVMNVSSAFDHRIVDGHSAASFMQRLKRVIEHPALLFVG
ncbi:MAG: dihydrolipoamide acetyltransferase family protein [Hyphomonadaceae bacterium]|nr:dihydrolipoamide acetyltransferase family protein [Hyphomonadaceae bacterium]